MKFFSLLLPYQRYSSMFFDEEQHGDRLRFILNVFFIATDLIVTTTTTFTMTTAAIITSTASATTISSMGLLMWPLFVLLQLLLPYDYFYHSASNLSLLHKMKSIPIKKWRWDRTKMQCFTRKKEWYFSLIQEEINSCKKST